MRRVRGCAHSLTSQSSEARGVLWRVAALVAVDEADRRTSFSLCALERERRWVVEPAPWAGSTAATVGAAWDSHELNTQ